MMRLARAQGEMVRSLEARLTQQERTVASLSALCAELDRLVSSGGSGGLAHFPGALRALAAEEAALREARMELDNIRSQLIAAKARHKSLDQRAKGLREAWERKTGEEEALEAALVMTAKASGKADVVI